MKQNIIIIGAGNLATHLAIALKKQDFNILQVYSRTRESVQLLAQKVQSNYTTVPNQISKDGDIYFVALKDSVVTDFLEQANLQNKLLVHCSGSLNINVLQNYSTKTGVFYPLQTFSKNRPVDFKTIPIFIEANSKKIEDILFDLGRTISDSVSFLNSEKRKILHISAVFACNFVNHFYAIASNILASHEIPFDVLRPLILETALKVQELSPVEVQTGPAVRFDENIIGKHLDELKKFPAYRQLYNSISKSIFEHYKNKF